MKFARYLEETQTPEWKKAYIDYRGLKKHINVIQKARDERQREILENVDKAERPRSRSATPPLSPHKLTFVEESPEITLRKINRMSEPHVPGVVGMARGGLNRMSLRGIVPNLMAPLGKSRPTSTVGSIGSRAELLHSLPLHEILPLLSPQEAEFFTLLDQQLDKVENFFCAREEEMLSRDHLLQTQLNGLNEHRKILCQKQMPSYWADNFNSTFNVSRLVSDYRRTTSSGSTHRVESTASPSTVNSFPTFVSSLHFSPQGPIPSVALSPTPSMGKKRETYEERPRGRNRDSPLKYKASTVHMPDTDSDRYISARRKLKKAVLEHYRGLELLDNYRIMNQTGFRKILKKFEKLTKIPVQNQYMREKVEKCSFASSGEIKDLMKRMEERFAVAFLDDDKKKAVTRLRTVTTPQTHHLITFRVGLYLGLAVPALIGGLYQASRQLKGKGEVLLYLYGVLVLPLMFALLVGLNIAAWASARINYVFIFELDVLSRIDHRQFFEIPAFLFTTLIYSFWLSFWQIGSTQIHSQNDATLWPLIWLLFAIVVIINPFPILHRSSRYWFLRSLGKQFLSGTRPVDFTDFWMGDQLCSMTFTLSHLATFICAYVHRFKDNFPDDLDKTCGTLTNMWGVELALLCLPQAIRCIQSVKRYADSPIHLHLINAGKYATGIIYTVLYLKWRSDSHRGSLFAFWCLLGVFSSLYACAWDLLMDWSLLERRINTKYPFLRSELLYPNHVPLYYFAIVTNILARFSWILYAPKDGPDFLARTFFVALLEMLRRFQWNFFRLENEHLGNVDQYRVTREVPLPYPRMAKDDDELEDQIRKVQSYRT